MVNMLLFETRLPFASSCRSTCPHCNTVYCWRGHYDITDITHINAMAAARVSQGYHTLENSGNLAFPWKIREISGNLPSSSRNFLKTAISQEILREWLWHIQVLLLIMLCCFALSFQAKSLGKNHSPRVDISNIYLPMVNWWMAWLHKKTVFTFTLWNGP